MNSRERLAGDEAQVIRAASAPNACRMWRSDWFGVEEVDLDVREERRRLPGGVGLYEDARLSGRDPNLVWPVPPPTGMDETRTGSGSR